MASRRAAEAAAAWLGALLTAAAAVFFALVLWPGWRPRVEAFFAAFDPVERRLLIALSLASALLSQAFAPCAWQRILRVLSLPGLRGSDARRNWYVTQMGSYIPGKFWMYIGRAAFLGARGAGSARSSAAIALENIYLMVSVCLMALAAIPFTGGAHMPEGVRVALAVSIGATLLALFAPGIRRGLAAILMRRPGGDPGVLPELSLGNQAVIIGFDMLSWTFRGASLFFWFLAAGAGAGREVQMLSVCLLAMPVSWLAALLLVIVPGGIGLRESVQGVLLQEFAGASLAVSATIALSHRIVLIASEGAFAAGALVLEGLWRRHPSMMRQIRQAGRLAASLVRARLFMMGIGSPPPPVNLTFSITRRCQSRCRTCSIWKAPPLDELSLAEIGDIFREIGWTYFFNVSGGEPFLRDDLPGIVGLACRHLDPAVIHIPTNALLPERIEAMTAEMLDIIAREAPGAALTIKPSFDGVGDLHDEIRGVPGNFSRLLDTLERLKDLRERHPELHVGVGTVISRDNAGRLGEIIEFAGRLGVDTYINEIAEEREEFFNLGSGITPDPDTYRTIMLGFKDAALERMRGMKLLGRITTALRIVYYDLVVRIMEESRQVIPCYAGILNAHINADGALWPCAIRAYGSEMGRAGRGGSFSAAWRSGRAREIRRSIMRGECSCPLANQAYSNILMHAPSLLRALRTALFPGGASTRRTRKEGAG
ncbi:radical SAM protein [Candidatus Fermentibacteria bacterium]|nr:radical SAM protein [Candidatus Fermentibacteria bacterium]